MPDPERARSTTFFQLLGLHLRLARRRRARRRIRSQILDETQDPYRLADLGVAPRERTLLERFPLTLLHIPR